MSRPFRRFGLILASIVFVAACANGTSSTNDTVTPTGDGGGTTTGDDDGGVVVGDDAGATDSGGARPAPAPVLTSIDPTSVKVGALGPTLVVTGVDFVQRSIVRLDGSDLPTTFVSETELRAPIPTAKLALAASLKVTVFTDLPGGGTSAEVPFDVLNVVPSLTDLAPSSAMVGSGDTGLTLTGSDFAPGVRVTFDGTDLSIGSSTATTIVTTIPASLLTAQGSHNVVVVNHGPGGGPSTPIAFTVTNPAAINVSSVNPNSALAGDPTLGITIVGNGFVASSSVTFNGNAISSSFVDSNHLTATVPAARLATAGNFNIVVTNPPPGGGVSSPTTFQVRNPVPNLVSVSPNTAYYLASDKTVVLNGAGFVSGSKAHLVTGSGTVDLATTYVNANEVDAVVPAANLNKLATLQINVTSPVPGGGTSQNLPFYVTCDPTGVQLALGPVGSVSTFATSFDPNVTANRIASAACPTTLSGSAQPFRTWVVQNTQASAVTLSAWGVCTSDANHEDDAFLALYRTGTPPADDNARKACTGVASEGKLGAAGNYSAPSPDDGASNYCPGLTKANGGGISLATCERAVVYVAPYSSTSTYFPPPSQIRIKAE